jgi:hypothetical protein
MLMAGADVGTPKEGMYIGIPVEEWPRVVLSPAFAPCLAAIKVRRVTKHCCKGLLAYQWRSGHVWCSALLWHPAGCNQGEACYYHC